VSLAAYVKVEPPSCSFEKLYSREFPVEPLAGPARSSVFKTHAPGGGCPVSHTCIIFSEALFDAPLRNDMELVCGYKFQKKQVDMSMMMGARPLSS